MFVVYYHFTIYLISFITAADKLKRQKAAAAALRSISYDTYEYCGGLKLIRDNETISSISLPPSFKKSTFLPIPEEFRQPVYYPSKSRKHSPRKVPSKFQQNPLSSSEDIAKINSLDQSREKRSMQHAIHTPRGCKRSMTPAKYDGRFPHSIQGRSKRLICSGSGAFLIKK
ncbi:hypothetical protein M8J76_014290 [Diaphorina citri]|nr:hypothetical protein M8J76_014290 [Diaphorina citri]